MKQLYLLILFLLFTIGLKAQIIERFVFNSCGNTATNNGITLRTNIGEPIVTKKGNANTMLSQGLLPGSFEIINSSSNTTISSNPSSIIVYPNPSNSIINFTNNTIIKMVEVENLVGQKVISQINSNNTLDISNLTQGVFIIKFYDNQNHIISISKIIKQ